MADNVQWAGYAALMNRLGKLAKVTFADAVPLLEEGERIRVEGVRRKVLGAKQGDGSPMPPVTYRTGIARRTQARKGRNFGIAKHEARGIGHGGIKSGDPHANGNLTTAEYRRLTGPPLAPRGEKSRIITNLETSIGQDRGRFYVAIAWRDVVDKDGRPFLEAHFNGASTGRGHRTKLPKRDMRGVDDKERAAWRDATRKWARWLLSGKP